MNALHSSFRRRRLSVAAIALLALSALLVGPVPAANAVPPTVPSADVTLPSYDGEGDAIESRNEEFVYGSLSAGPKSFVVGSKTASIQLDLSLMPPGENGNYPSICFSADRNGNAFAENMGGGRFRVLPGAIIPSAAPFLLECDGDLESDFTSTIVKWNALYSAQAPASVNFGVSVAKQILEQVQTGYSGMNPSSAALVGGRVRAYAPVGSWGSPTTKTTTTVLVGPNKTPAVSINATRDGSILGFNLPKSIAPSSAAISAKSVSEIAETATAPLKRTITKWDAKVQVVSAYTSTTLRLDKTTALSSQAVKATATITTSNGSVPAGPVGFYVDGMKVATVNMSTNAVGNATFILRNLKSGTRSVTAKFEGTTPLAPSTSPVVKLKILG